MQDQGTDRFGVWQGQLFGSKMSMKKRLWQVSLEPV